MELKEALQAGNIVVSNGLVGVIMSNNMVYYNNGCFDRVGGGFLKEVLMYMRSFIFIRCVLMQ